MRYFVWFVSIICGLLSGCAYVEESANSSSKGAHSTSNAGVAVTPAEGSELPAVPQANPASTAAKIIAPITR